MGNTKCFNFLGGLEVTFILRDYKTVTGRIIRDFADRKCNNSDSCSNNFIDSANCNKCDNHSDEHSDFVVLELTRDAKSVSLQQIEVDGGLEIEWVNVEFSRGSRIAVNVSEIIYAGVNAEIDKEEFEIGLATSETVAIVPAK